MKLLPLLFLLLFTVGLAQAGDEQTINQALQNNKVVTLPPGTYYLDDYVKLNSGNALIGYGAKLKVRPTSTQWFKGDTGLVCSKGPVNDVWIEGIEIDGSCAELNKDLANTPGHKKDCERGIIINGATDNFCHNITIKNIKVYDTFSDGVHIRFAEEVLVTDSIFSNNQHEGCYFVCVRNGLIQRIKVAGITSDDARMDNCEFCKALNCTFVSYTGPNNNGAWQGHQNGIQISDQGFSFGGGSDKSDIIHTNNIEVAYCIFANMGKPIWLDSSGNGLGDNIYVHDNRGVDLETSGYSFENPPTINQSEKVFNNIFDILYYGVSDTGNSEHDNTKKEVIAVHDEAVNITYEKPLIPPITILFIGVVVIILVGAIIVLQVIV